jgi:hypothetical protein
MPFVTGAQFEALREQLGGTRRTLGEALETLGIPELSEYQQSIMGVYQCRCGVWVPSRIWYQACPHCGSVGIEASETKRGE